MFDIQKEDYINELFSKGIEKTAYNQHNAKAIKAANSYYKKARCALEYFYLLDKKIVYSTTHWATRWEVSTTTALNWIREFKK
jgi:hypothetical protein